MSLPPPPYTQPPQLSPQQLQQLQLARKGMRKIRRAVATATFDGWTVALFGVLTFLFGIGDVTSMVLGVALTVIGGLELHAARRLKRLEIAAIKVLVGNQAALGTVLLMYALWRIFVVLHYPAAASLLGSEAGELEEAGLKDAANLERSIMLAVYYSLIAIAVLGQGSMAFYYLSRRKYVRAYLTETPPWITQLQQAGMGV